MKSIYVKSLATFGAAACVMLAGAFSVAQAETPPLPGTPSLPISLDQQVTPYIIFPDLTGAENQGGNRDCGQVAEAFGKEGGFQCYSERVNTTDGFFASDPYVFGADPGILDPECFQEIEVSTDGTYVSFDALVSKVGAAIVKGGNDANVYYYDPQVVSDSGLAAPPNASSVPAGLSNLTFCWDYEPIALDPGAWCSPGYWRQPHHLWAWAATGISPDDKYNTYFDPDLAGDPTLLQVLQSPQTYGGRAFNNVGDLLSEAHPDVNFLGERVEDSCPLGREPM